MKSKVESITPEYAMEVLEHHNPRNRSIAENTVNSYALDMKNGRWTLNHQGIAFDENGDLIDGQHRLWAVVFSGKTIEMLVTRGIPVEEKKGDIILRPMDNIDHMRVRQAGQQLQLGHGIKNGNQVAACLRGIAYMCAPAHGRTRLSTATTLAIYELYGKDVEAILACLDNKQRVSHITSPLAMYHHGEPEKAIKYCQQFRTLEAMESPVRMFHKYLEQKHKGSGLTERTMRIHAKCIEHFHRGHEIKAWLQDDFTGIKFLCSMFPSMNRRIADQLKPIAGKKIIRTFKKESE